MFRHTGTHENQSMHVLQCDITCPSPCYKYAAATQKGVADLSLYQLATMHMQMHVYANIKIFSLHCSYIYIRIANKAACMHSKHDDQDW